MRVFLDANVLVSVLNKELPIFSFTARILSLIDNPSFKIYTSRTCLAIAFYFAEKKSGRVLAKKKIKILAEKIQITTGDKATVIAALKNPKIHDFEDGLEYYSAVTSKCRCIITEDISDFYFSEIEVLNASMFLEKYFK